MKIRDFTTKDFEKIYKLHTDSAEGAGFSEEVATQDFDKDIYNKYISSGGCFKLVEIDEKIVAMGGLLKVSEDRAEVASVRVHPQYQQQGVGTFLMIELEQHARASGFKVLWLDTINVDAYNFYLKLNYQLLSQEPEGEYTCYQFEKRLF